MKKTKIELTPEQTEALREFAAGHGRNWKDALRALWNQGSDTGYLRQIRNQVGPVGIEKVTI